MALTGNRTFVGFGFGAIQAGLFLYEAFQSGNFSRLVVAEVLPEAVNAIRTAEGFLSVNIAHADRVEVAKVGPLEIPEPDSEAGRERLVDSIAQAAEIATAVPSVSFYAAPGRGSIHRILAEGLWRVAGLGRLYTRRRTTTTPRRCWSQEFWRRFLLLSAGWRVQTSGF